MDDRVVREVERFLYREARLLDERRFHEWLELFTEDVRYWMVTRADRYPKSSKAVAALDPGWAAAEPENDDALAILDESKATLAGRVARLETGMAWAEDPPSRTRHIIANIEVELGRHRGRACRPFELHCLQEPRRDRAGFLCRRPAGLAAPGRRRAEDRPPQADPRSERAAG